jgi:hypothetical protein
MSGGQSDGIELEDGDEGAARAAVKILDYDAQGSDLACFVTAR